MCLKEGQKGTSEGRYEPIAGGIAWFTELKTESQWA